MYTNEEQSMLKMVHGAVEHCFMPDIFTNSWYQGQGASVGAVLAIEQAGELVGGVAYQVAEGAPELWLWDLVVRPELRRRGLGGAAYGELAALLGRKGARQLLCRVTGGQRAGPAFLAGLGFRPWGGSIVYGLELATVALDWGDPEAGLAAQGLRCSALERFPRGGLATRLLPLWNRSRPDQPQLWPFVPYSARRLEAELLEPAAVDLAHSLAVVAPDTTIVAVCVSARLGDNSLGSLYLGVDPAWRGRGLAAALKGALIARARGAGFATLLAENDLRSEAMHALNRRLGYRQLAERLVFRQTLA